MIIWLAMLAAACTVRAAAPSTDHENTVGGAVGSRTPLVKESPGAVEPCQGKDRTVVGRSVTVNPPTATCGAFPMSSAPLRYPRRHGATTDPTYELLVKLQRQTQSYQGNNVRERYVPRVLLCRTKACPGRRYPIRRVAHTVISHKLYVGGPECSGVRKPLKGLASDTPRPCAVDIGPVTLAKVFTFSFWARPTETPSYGTLVEIGPLQISVVALGAEGRTLAGIRITLGPHVSTYNAQNWTDEGWNHIAVQVDRTSGWSLHLALNGRPMGDILWTNLPDLTRTTLSSMLVDLHVGTRKTTGLGTGHRIFGGEVDKVELYAAILTEREVYQLFSGYFEPLPGPFKDCLCPEKYPFINRTDYGSSCCASSRCYHGDGNRIIRQTFEMSPRTILVGSEAVIDGVIGPYVWISTPGVANVSLDIDLGRKTEVSSVNVVLHSAPPELGLVLSFNEGADWLPWHYFSYNCSDFTPSHVHTRGRYTTCEQIEKVGVKNAVWILKWQELSEVLSSQVVRTGNIRVTLLGFPGHEIKGHNRPLKYHVISEIQVRERCAGKIQRKPSRPVYFAPQDVQSSNRKSSGLHYRKKRQSDTPEVNNIFPSFGPISGDSIQVTGNNFGSNMSVSFRSARGQEFDCVCTPGIARSFNEGCNNDKFIGCFLQIPANSGLQVGELLTAFVLSADDTPVPTSGNDTYRVGENPIINDVNPRKTFISGGVRVTVTGEHLTSVAAPKMLLSVTYPDREKLYRFPGQGSCTVQNDTNMICLTPKIVLPAVYINFRSRRKRSYDVGETLSAAGELSSRRRVKRQEENLEEIRSLYLNDDILEVDIGFVLGGSTVANITMERADIMLVARDPFIDQFNKDIYEFRRYSPYNEEVLEIFGNYLDRAAKVEDLNITVGDEPCEITQLITNVVTCRPPAEKPTQGKFTKSGNPRIIVTIGNIDFSPGYVDYQFTKPVNVALIAGVVVGVVVLAIIIAVVVYCYRYISRMPKAGPHTLLDEKGDYTTLLTEEKSTVMDLLDEELKLKISDCTISSDRLSRHKEIGKGNFGKVFLGKLSSKRDGVQSDENVAVKTIRDEGVTLRQVSEFLEEATIMKDFDHPNVLSLLGVVIEDNRPYVLLPFMANGDLKSYVSKPEKEFLVVDLLALAAQVTDGMAYLAGNKFVHRDLRAVNCMVDSSVTVKVGDFGLARDMYQGDYYKVQDQQRPLPVKWMAPESLSGGVFSSRTDVWAFAVLLWEVMTRGLKPYASVDNFKMRQFLLRGHRLEKPDYCPEKVYGMMLKCWSIDSQKRPEFVEIGKQLRAVIQDTAAPSYNEVARKPDEDYIEVRRPPTVLNEYLKRPSTRTPDYLELVEGPVPDRADVPTAESPANVTSHHYENEAEGVPTNQYENDRLSDYLAPVKADEGGGPMEDSPLMPAEQAPNEAVEPRYKNTPDSPLADLPTEQAPDAPTEAAENTERVQNPYFVNPPISDDYLSPEAKEKLEHSSNPPRGRLVGKDPDYENTKNEKGEKEENTQGSGSGIAARAAMFGGVAPKSPDYANQPGVQLRKKNRKPEGKGPVPVTVPLTGVPHRGNETDGYVTTT